MVNTPRRGIGTTSIAKIRELAADEGISFFSACELAIAETGLLGAKARQALAEFTGAIEAGRHFTGELADVVDAIVDRRASSAPLEAEHSVEADGRIENIKEFMGVAAEFDETHDAVETLESLEQLRAAGATSRPAPRRRPRRAQRSLRCSPRRFARWGRRLGTCPLRPPVASEKLRRHSSSGWRFVPILTPLPGRPMR